MNKFFVRKLGNLRLAGLFLTLCVVLVPFTFAEPIPTDSSGENKDELTEEAKQEILFLNKLKDELNFLAFEYENIDGTIQLAKDRVEIASETKMSLTEHLDMINSQLENTKDQILNVSKQIVEKENEIELLFEMIEIKKVELEEQKRALSEFMKLAYINKSAYYDFENDEISVLNLLLSDQDISEILRNSKYISILKETGKQILEKLANIESDLESKQKKLHLSRKELQHLKNRLSQEETNLQEQKQGKEYLLAITQNEEAVYSKLLSDSLEEQEKIVDELQALQVSMDDINSQIASLKDDFDMNELASLIDSADIFADDIYDESGDLILRWPVSPTLGISAYYHDPTYRAAFGFTHNAIDLPTPQGTPIHSPAYGVVTKVRDNGFGYSYLVISHSRNISTLYGHVSKFLVKEGDPVFAGQILALSGGKPGTIGAGLMTTGAHLHFEVFKNGQHVDPLYFLDLSGISLGNLPDKYKNYYEEHKDFYKIVSEFLEIQDEEDYDPEKYGDLYEFESEDGYEIEIDEVINIEDLTEIQSLL